MLEVDSICIEIDDVPIINQLSFNVKQGQLLHLKGENGAGKTTLLRTLAGLGKKSQGNISFQGNQTIGYIGHQPLIEPLLTVEENIESMVLGEALLLDSKEALTQLDLLKYKDTFAHHLSQGQKKRLSLAKFIMVKKSLWLLDEPFTALDIKHQLKLKSFISNYIRQNGSVILTSHLDIIFEDIVCRELTL